MAVQLQHHNYFPCVRAPFDLWAEEELTSRNANLPPGAKRCKLKDFMTSAHTMFDTLDATAQTEYEQRYHEYCRVQGVVPTTPALKKKKRGRPANASSIQKKPKPTQTQAKPVQVTNASAGRVPPVVTASILEREPTQVDDDWTIAPDQASLLELDWTAEQPRHNISLLFKSGTVALGFGHSVRPRTLVVDAEHNKYSMSRVQLNVREDQVSVGLQDEGCGECCGEEVYRFQLQQTTEKTRRLRIECFAECSCDGYQEVDKFSFFAHPNNRQPTSNTTTNKSEPDTAEEKTTKAAKATEEKAAEEKAAEEKTAEEKTAEEKATQAAKAAEEMAAEEKTAEEKTAVEKAASSGDAATTPYCGPYGAVGETSVQAAKYPSGDPGRASPASALFAAAPSNPKLRPFAVSSWTGPAGFVHLVSRMSALCYTVAAYCREPSKGAHYSLLKIPRVYCKALVWAPPPGCARGGAHAPDADQLVDAVSVDLFIPGSNPPQSKLTANELLDAVNEQTKFLFVNSLHDPDGLALVIEKCNNLQCVCLIETTISLGVLSALIKHANSLRGLHLHMCKCDDERAPMAGLWCKLLNSTTQLLWWYVEGGAVGRAAFRNLPESLKVLGYEGEHEDSLRAALPQLSRQLTHLMVNKKHTGASSVKLPAPVPFKLYGVRHSDSQIRGIYDSWDQVLLLKNKHAELRSSANVKKFENVDKQAAQEQAAAFSKGAMQLSKSASLQR